MLTLAFVFSFGFGRVQEHPGGDSWFGADKAKHFLMSAFIQSASYSGLRAVHLGHEASLGGATVVAGAFGIGKEISDAKGGTFVSAKDLTWDAAGIAAASVLVSHTGR
jgi:putative lipoprotein